MKTFTTPNGRTVIILNYGRTAIKSDEIKFIKGDGNYSSIITREGYPTTSSFTLKVFSKTLNQRENFASPAKGLLVNLDYMKGVLLENGSKYVLMNDGSKLPISRRKFKTFTTHILNSKRELNVIEQ